MVDPLLLRTCELASRYLDSLDERPVGRPQAPETLVNALGGPLPAAGESPEAVIEHLARHADPGLVASTGGRFFGFVVGGALPSAHAADWLVTTWDQNAGFYVLSPVASVIEQIVSGWILDLLGLPHESAVGFVTGCQMANVMGLAAARQAVLQRAGWDAATQGLIGAPRIRVITSAEAHGTIDRALAMLGLGSACATRVPCDDQGRMRSDALGDLLADGEPCPTIVCAQAGNVNTGAFDPLAEIGGLCREHGAWLHVDGAFGLWAAASPRLRPLVAGAQMADSWATDAHKWLNVPYDSGLVIVRDRVNLLAATNYRGEYLVRSNEQDDRCSHTPESSRRARAIPLYAALREMGSGGVASLVERSCELARRAADRLSGGGATILNDVVLNQVLAVFPAPDGEDPATHTQAIIDRVQRDGTCWLGGTTWQGRRVIRLSVCGWKTTEEDIDRSVDAILRCSRAMLEQAAEELRRGRD